MALSLCSARPPFGICRDPFGICREAPAAILASLLLPRPSHHCSAAIMFHLAKSHLCRNCSDVRNLEILQCLGSLIHEDLFSKAVIAISVFATAESQLLPVKRWDVSEVLLFQGTCKIGRAEIKLLWLVSESVSNLTGRLLAVKSWI